MIKICSESVTIPLKIIFEESLKKGIFPKIWKKANLVPVDKKEDKTLIRNYRPSCSLPVFGKIFERVIYDSLLTIFLVISFLHLLNQVFFQEIHLPKTAFDSNHPVDVIGTFLDISKVSDKVLHDGLIFKLKSYGAERELLSLIKNYLQNREQRVVLNGQTSGWRKINTGVLQGSVLGPLLFLIYTNDSMCKIFVKDKSMGLSMENAV